MCVHICMCLHFRHDCCIDLPRFSFLSRTLNKTQVPLPILQYLFNRQRWVAAFFFFNLLNFSHSWLCMTLTLYSPWTLQNKSDVRWFCMPLIFQLPVICSTNNSQVICCKHQGSFPPLGNTGGISLISKLEYAVIFSNIFIIFSARYSFNVFSYFTFYLSPSCWARHFVFLLSSKKCWQIHFSLLKMSLWQKNKV